MNILKKENLHKIFDVVYYESDQISLEQIHIREDFSKERNGYNFMKKEKLFEYLVEPFKVLQPKTYDSLKNGKFFYAIKKSTYPQNMDDLTQFGIIVNNACFYIEYSLDCYDDNRELYCFDYIPYFILNSWLFHSDMWNVAESTTTSIYKSRLPSTLKMPIHSVFNEFENLNNIDMYSDFLTKKFNHEFRRNYDEDKYNNMERYFQLLSLLDTRSTTEFNEKSGFQLFLSTHNDMREIYTITNADIFSIKKLDNAQEAIDLYGEHIISGKDGEFDFSPYLRDF